MFYHQRKKWTKFPLKGQSLCISFSMRLTNTHQPFENVTICTALHTAFVRVHMEKGRLNKMYEFIKLLFINLLLKVNK